MIEPAAFSVYMPMAIIWQAVSTPCTALLRIFGLAPKPVEEAADVNMSGRVVIVTGANTGIGNRTALHLARMGAKVIMACRSVDRAEAARLKMEQELRMDADTSARQRRSEPGTLEVMPCDLGNVDSVRAFARAFKERHGERLDVLVNNAGVGVGATSTVNGLDGAFGVNYVGHFLLTVELMPLIQATPAARVVCLSSVMHHAGCADWALASLGHKGHPEKSTYSDSKLAMIFLAKELRRRFQAAGSNAMAFAVNPGAVRSDIWRAIPRFVKPLWDIFMRIFFLDVEQGCSTSVCAASLPLERLAGCEYFQPYWLPFDRVLPFEIMGPYVGCAPGRPSLPANEAEESARFWKESEKIVANVDATRGAASSRG